MVVTMNLVLPLVEYGAQINIKKKRIRMGLPPIMMTRKKKKKKKKKAFIIIVRYPGRI
jgi:hypothetical protein